MRAFVWYVDQCSRLAFCLCLFGLDEHSHNISSFAPSDPSAATRKCEKKRVHGFPIAKLLSGFRLLGVQEVASIQSSLLFPTRRLRTTLFLKPSQFSQILPPMAGTLLGH